MTMRARDKGDLQAALRTEGTGGSAACRLSLAIW